MRAVVTLGLLFGIGTVAIGGILITFGHEPVEAFSAALACLSNIGPGLGAVGPMGSYGWMGTPEKLLLTGAMWLGRLEILTVLALLHPDVWRKLRW